MRNTLVLLERILWTEKDHHNSVMQITDGSSKLLIINRGGRVLVGGGGVSHYSKPYRVISK